MLGRTKSAMDIDPSVPLLGQFGPRERSRYPAHPPRAPLMSSAPLPDPVPSITLDHPGDESVEMGSSQDSNAMASEEEAGTRVPTPVPDLDALTPLSQGLNRMQSIVSLGPAIPSTPPPPPVAEPQRASAELLAAVQQHLAVSQEAHGRQLAALAELTQSLRAGMDAVVAEVGRLREEVVKARNEHGRERERDREQERERAEKAPRRRAAQRVRVAQHPR
ncbi:hypothetical protein BD413DRAFT_276427 [Trametes elegans]|nr:hypothetical protein BD413DRAFT_276427 [Trametes elegans]